MKSSKGKHKGMQAVKFIRRLQKFTFERSMKRLLTARTVIDFHVSIIKAIVVASSQLIL